MHAGGPDLPRFPLIALHLEPLGSDEMITLLRGLAPGLGDGDMARIV